MMTTAIKNVVELTLNRLSSPTISYESVNFRENSQPNAECEVVYKIMALVVCSDSLSLIARTGYRWNVRPHVDLRSCHEALYTEQSSN